jgi:hypothetical protein
MVEDKIRHIKSLDTFIDEQYGLRGTEKRDNFEHGFENFKQEIEKTQTYKHRFSFPTVKKAAAM